jgi:hypothetical protein
MLFLNTKGTLVKNNPWTKGGWHLFFALSPSFFTKNFIGGLWYGSEWACRGRILGKNMCSLFGWPRSVPCKNIFLDVMCRPDGAVKALAPICEMHTCTTWFPVWRKRKTYYKVHLLVNFNPLTKGWVAFVCIWSRFSTWKFNEDGWALDFFFNFTYIISDDPFPEHCIWWFEN